MARNYVVALIQKITFKDYLTILLGNSAYNRLIGRYQGYKKSTNPTISLEFSTAGFRFGHSMINSPYRFITNDGRVIQKLALGEMFFNPRLLKTNNLDLILRGLSLSSAKERTLEIVPDLRSFLVLDPSQRIGRSDLLAANVQRGRDHGLNTINEIRKAYGLQAVSSFSQIFGTGAVDEKMKKVIKNLDDLDPYLVVLGERSNSDGVLGEFATAIVVDQFKRLREGDNFWY